MSDERSGAGISEELGRLAELRDRGVLTEAEFAAAKARLLGSALPPEPPAAAAPRSGSSIRASLVRDAEPASASREEPPADAKKTTSGAGKAGIGCLAFLGLCIVIGVFGAGGNSGTPADANAASAKASEGVEAKAEAAIAAIPKYTRAEFPRAYKNVGKKMFARLGELEPGAIYAAAESAGCDEVTLSGVSGRSEAGKPLWFIDCKNGNRFMVSVELAEAALARAKQGKLAENALEVTCTQKNLGLCDASEVQRAAKEVDIVTFCDMLLKKAVVSPKSLDTAWEWRYGFDDDGVTVIAQRDFDSQNSFGALIRSRYHCEVNAGTGRITSFVVEGPMGSQRIL